MAVGPLIHSEMVLTQRDSSAPDFREEVLGERSVLLADSYSLVMYGYPALPRPKKVATGSGIADSLFPSSDPRRQTFFDKEGDPSIVLILIPPEETTIRLEAETSS
ncbi:UNVERIFIED_CONTAM: hypothetical protein Slati_4568800 [Sesamum latifolium]|uniref:Uncharacterized protein n=1 Tax=Sesamum latifolium TaxID=2727402 RepID=A0AAW2SG61_9LAMI